MSRQPTIPALTAERREFEARKRNLDRHSARTEGL